MSDQLLPASGFTVVHVRNDDDVVLQARHANDPDRGRLAVRVRPGIRTTDWLTRDLLAALGVDLQAAGNGRNADQNLQLLPVRLIARHITDVLVTGAESLTPTMLTDLVLLTAAARARLWLVTAPPVQETLSLALADWCPTEVNVSDAGDWWPRLIADAEQVPRAAADDDESADDVTASPAEPQRLPLVDATTLLAAARRLLPPAEAEWVNARLRTAVEDAGEALAAAADDPDQTTDRVAHWLLDRYDRAGTLPQFLTDVRGLQVAGLWQGLLIQVDVPALLGTAAAAPSASARTPEVWQRLRAYRLPVRGAACALAAAGLGSTAICGVTLTDTAADGGTVIVAGRVVPIEPNAASYVAEQRLLRLAAGAPLDAPLLTKSNGNPLNDKGLARMLSGARSEVGVVVTSRLVERNAPSGATTLRRWGLTITAIGAPVAGGPDTAHPTTSGGGQPPPGEAPLLDVDLLSRRRVEMHLSRGDVAKHLGVTSATVSRLESGVNHGEQPLALLLRLAGFLGLDLADLLPRTPSASTHATASDGSFPGGAAAADARLVGASLHALGVLVPVEALAEVLGWDAARLDAALAALEVTAPAVGLRVHRLYNRVSLVRAADALPADQLAAVLRHDAARTGLNPTQARLVLAALTRAVTPSAGRGGHHMLARSNADKVAAASLVGACILTTDDSGDLALHHDAAASLLVPADGERP
ncbi:helix-turn-helix domain-containing protein [Blastococcus sp. SYSU D00669]